MATTQYKIFLSSRFAEFREIREKLREQLSQIRDIPLLVIDLNDGQAAHNAPLAECLRHVRESDFLVLLLGSTYGELAPGMQQSFTHLEYLESIKENSATRVLVYDFGSQLPSDNQQLNEWRRDVHKYHTVCHLPQDQSTELSASKIINQVIRSLCVLIGGVGDLIEDSDAEEIPEEFDLDGAGLDLTSLYRNDFVEANRRGHQISDTLSSTVELANPLLSPAECAALEQRKFAQVALDIGEFGTAIQLLKRSLEHNPLDYSCNFHLAQLLLALDRKDLAPQVITLAKRASKLSVRNGRRKQAAAADLLACRAALMLQEHSVAIEFANQAVEHSGRFSVTLIELARCYLLSGRDADAMVQIQGAFTLFKPSAIAVYRDSDFFILRDPIKKMMKQENQKLIRSFENMLKQADSLYTVLDIAMPEAVHYHENYSILRIAREKVMDWFETISICYQAALTAVLDSEEKSIESVSTAVHVRHSQPAVGFTKADEFIREIQGFEAEEKRVSIDLAEKISAEESAASNLRVLDKQGGVIILLFGTLTAWAAFALPNFSVIPLLLLLFSLVLFIQKKKTGRNNVLREREMIASLRGEIAKIQACKADRMAHLKNLRSSSQEKFAKALAAIILFEKIIESAAFSLTPFRLLGKCSVGDIARIDTHKLNDKVNFVNIDDFQKTGSSSCLEEPQSSVCLIKIINRNGSVISFSRKQVWAISC